MTRFSSAIAALTFFLSSTASSEAGFITDPVFGFTYSDPYGNVGFGTLQTVSSGLADDSLLAIAGNLTLTSSADGNASVGDYLLLSAGPGVTLTASGLFLIDDLLYPNADAALGVNPGMGGANSYLTLWGLHFGSSTPEGQREINIWGNGNGDYAFWSAVGGHYTISVSSGGAFTLDRIPAVDPGLANAVPEPSSFVLFSVGLACVGVASRHLRRRQSGTAARSA